MVMPNCPVCSGSDTQPLLQLDRLPVFCNVQYADPATATAQPRGRLDLQHCNSCGHFFNAAFDPSQVSYGDSYENSLHFSPTFSGFARELAAELVERFGLEAVQVVDIGCGKGDFLKLLCQLGGNEGHGFDPSYDPARESEPVPVGVHFHARTFGPAESGLDPRLVSCRQVIEHIARPVPFLSGIVAALSTARSPVFYLEVPNALFTIRDLGIWDLIYEHCHYFSPQSFDYLARQSGLAPGRVYESFGGQYLGLEAEAGEGAAEAGGPPGSAYAQLAEDFQRRSVELLQRWRQRLAELTSNGPAVVWGAGSKGVSFANMMQAPDQIAALVDINPYKQGRFIAGTGHPIVAPEALSRIDPAVVLVMNPLYEAEIGAQVSDAGCRAELCTVA